MAIPSPILARSNPSTWIVHCFVSLTSHLAPRTSHARALLPPGCPHQLGPHTKTQLRHSRTWSVRGDPADLGPIHTINTTLPLLDNNRLRRTHHQHHLCPGQVITNPGRS